MQESMFPKRHRGPQSAVFPAAAVDLQQCPAAFSKCGRGYVGYIGDVNNELGSQKLLMAMLGKSNSIFGCLGWKVQYIAYLALVLICNYLSRNCYLILRSAKRQPNTNTTRVKLNAGSAIQSSIIGARRPRHA